MPSRPRLEPPLTDNVPLHLQGGPSAGHYILGWWDVGVRVAIQGEQYYFSGYKADGMRCYLHAGLANMTPADFFHDAREASDA